MDQQLYNTTNTQGRGTSLDSLFGQFNSAGLGAPQPGLMDQTGRRGGDSILGAPHQEYQPMEGNYSWADNYSRFAAPHNFTAVETLMSELAPEDHFGGGDPHLTSLLQQFLMKQQLPPQHGMPSSYITDDLLMNTSAGHGTKPQGTGAGGNRSRGGSFHVKLENQQQQMAMLEQQQQQQQHMGHHPNTGQGHQIAQQGQPMQQSGHGQQGNPGDIYGALELLSAYLGTNQGQFPETQGYPGQLGGGSNVSGQQAHLGDPYFDLLNGGGTSQGNPYQQYMNPYYQDYMNFDPNTSMKGTNPHSAAGGKPPAYQQAASHYMGAGGHPGAGYPMDQQAQHELLQQLFKEDQQHQQHQHRQYEDLTNPHHTPPPQQSQQQQQAANQQQQQQQTAVSQQGKQGRGNAPSAQGKTSKNPSAGQAHVPQYHAQQQQQMNAAANSRMKPENMHGNKGVPSAATTGKNDKIPPQPQHPQQPGGYPPARMGVPSKPGMMMNDWADGLSANDYLPDSIKSLIPAQVRDQLMKKSQEYYEYMRRGGKDPSGGMLHHPGLAIPASSTHLLQGFAPNSRGLMSAAFPQMPPKRIGQLTAEERRTKIEKYLTKRKKRSWSKKISYDCRKRVADSRLRIKGRFVTKEQAVAVLGADEQMNLTEIKEMLVTKFGVAPTPRRRGSGQAGELKDGTRAGDLEENAEDGQDEHNDHDLEHEHDHENDGEMVGLGVHDHQQHVHGKESVEHEHQLLLGNVPNGVNVGDLRPEDLPLGDLEKVALDSQHFDVLDTNKLIASVTNNVS